MRLHTGASSQGPSVDISPAKSLYSGKERSVIVQDFGIQLSERNVLQEQVLQDTVLGLLLCVEDILIYTSYMDTYMDM